MDRPIVIAHRGVPGQRLEHTRSSYEMAIDLGADFIEPDVVCTGDGHLVVRHENEISVTTDVAERPEFADRRTTRTVDGTAHTGWFTEDFTLAELKTLWARERLPELRPQNVSLNGTERILSFAEVLDIAAAGSRRRGTPVGVYVETKHPTYFAGLGLGLDDRLIDALQARDLNRSDAQFPVIIESFETGNLQRLRSGTPLTLVQLIRRTEAPVDLATIATYADGIGPDKNLIIGRDAQQCLTGSTGLVGRAHAAGLLVHAWTLRDENNFLPRDLRIGNDLTAHGDASQEYRMFFEEGVDGVFCDHTATALRAREAWRPEAHRRRFSEIAGVSRRSLRRPTR